MREKVGVSGCAWALYEMSGVQCESIPTVAVDRFSILLTAEPVRRSSQVFRETWTNNLLQLSLPVLLMLQLEGSCSFTNCHTRLNALDWSLTIWMCNISRPVILLYSKVSTFHFTTYNYISHGFHILFSCVIHSSINFKYPLLSELKATVYV